MTRINLLPWRETEQRRRSQRFMLALVLALVVGIAIVYWGWLMADSAVSSQQARNAYLRHEVAALNLKIQKINRLRADRKDLLKRMRVIQRLQQSRPLAVHLFEQLAQTVPSSIYLTSVVFKFADSGSGRVVGQLALKGIADSPAGVSNYMRRMAASPWLDTPALQVVRTTRAGGKLRSSFSVSSRLLIPDDDPNAASAAQGAGP